MLRKKFEIFEKHLKNVGIDFSVKVLSEEELTQKGLLEYISDDLDDVYVNDVTRVQINPMEKQEIDVIYSSQNGAACTVTEDLFELINFKLNVVEKHRAVDPDFTFSPCPNPEDPKAFELLIKDGSKINADLIMSTDPDGDRFGCGVLHNGEYRLFTGNETAALILEYVLSNKVKNNSLGKDAYAIFTNVTGMLGKDICESYGVKMHETLTGFKWIGSVYNKQLEKGLDNFIVGYEESYGFLLSDVGRDKDSLQAGLLLAEMTQFYKKQGLTLFDQLNKIYDKYGHRIEYTSSLVLKGSEGMKKIAEIISFFEESDFEDIAKDGIIKMIDFKKQKVFSKNNTENIDIPSHPCIKLFFDENNWLAIRPSGTEPKIKFYFSLNGKDNKEVQAIHTKVKNYVDNIKTKFNI